MNQPSRRIKVLFVIVQLDILGGSEQLVYRIIERLDRGRFEPFLAWFSGDGKLEEFKRLGIPLYHVPKEKRFDARTMRRLARIIEDNRIDVVNAHHFLSLVYSFYGSRIRNRVRLVYTEHSVWELDRISPAWRLIGRCLARRADAAVGVTDAVTAAIGRTFGTDPARTVTILNGADDAAVPTSRAELRKGFGLGEREQVIGIVANLKKVKNHLFLLQAFAGLIRIEDSARLLIIGQGLEQDPENTEPEIRAFVAQNSLGGKVLLAGYRTDIADLLGIMDVFCLCSRKEGLPIGLIEAMAAGLPVVGTAVDGIRDVIAHGRNGLLVHEQDVPGLTEALARLLRNEELRRTLGNAARITVQDRYSLSRCVSRYEQLFGTARGRWPSGRPEEAVQAASDADP
jgi:glycosyltransferase involved in cell wall biosynthesis